MSVENQEKYLHLRAIEIIFEAEDDSAIIRRLTPDNPLSQFLISSLLTERAVDQLIAAPPLQQPTSEVHEAAVESSSSEANAPKEKNPSVVLTGKLKTAPKEGKPDGKGHPTAW